MEPIISPWYFYWVNVAGTAKGFLVGVLIIIAIIAVTITVLGTCFLLDGGEILVDVKKITKFLFIAACIAGSAFILIPSEQTCNKMLVTSLVTPDNIDYVQSLGQDFGEWVVDTVNRIQNNNTEGENK